MTAIAHGHLIFRQPSSTPERAAGRPPNLAERFAGKLRLWRRRIRDREALLRFTHRDMRDMGITPADISWEVSQPFWREAPRR